MSSSKKLVSDKKQKDSRGKRKVPRKMFFDEVVDCGGMNTSEDRIKQHIEHNIRLGLPQIKPYLLNNDNVIIAGGGPSLESCFDELKEQYDKGYKVVAVNDTHDWLIERGIIPSVYVMLDGRPFNASFLNNPIPTCKYFLSSQCHPDSFRKLAGYQVYIFHCDAYNVEKEILEPFYHNNYHIIIGGSTVVLRAIMLMRMLGFQYIDLYGFDSCWIDDKHHPYEQKQNDGEKTCILSFRDYDPDGPTFKVSFWMGKQLQEFQRLVNQVGDLFKLNVHGDGLVAYMLKLGAELNQEQMEQLKDIEDESGTEVEESGEPSARNSDHDKVPQRKTGRKTRRPRRKTLESKDCGAGARAAN